MTVDVLMDCPYESHALQGQRRPTMYGRLGHAMWPLTTSAYTSFLFLEMACPAPPSPQFAELISDECISLLFQPNLEIMLLQ